MLRPVVGSSPTCRRGSTHSGWSHWHRRVILALGITWILDGLEASLISNLGPTIEKTTSWTNAEVGASNTPRT